MCPLCATELMSMSDAIMDENNNANDVASSSKDGRVDGVIIPSNDGVGNNSSPPPPPRPKMEPPSDSVSLHSNSSSPQQPRRERRAPQVGHHYQQDDRSVDNRSVYSARSAPSTFINHNRNNPQQQQRSPPPQQQRRVSIASKQTSNLSVSDSSCESTVDMSYESGLNLNSNNNNYNSRPGLRRVDSTGSASVFSQSSRGSMLSSGSRNSSATATTNRSPGISAGRRHNNHQQQPQQQQQQLPHRGHHSPIDAPPVDDNNGYNNSSVRHDQEQFVCGWELFVNDTRCFYTGQIHMETQLPHGLGTLRCESGHGMSEGQWHFGRLVQESNGGGAAPPPPPPPPQVNNLGVSSNYPRDVNSQDCQEDGSMLIPLGYSVEEEEYYDEEDNQDESLHHHQEEYQEEEEELANYCLPCTSANEEESLLCNDLREQCQVEESSIAETVGEEYDVGSETDSQEISYTARESKSPLPPSSESSSPSGRHSSSNTRQKLQEYKRYIVNCDEEENYYHDEQGRAVHSKQCVENDYERPTRRVRFQEDP